MNRNDICPSCGTRLRYDPPDSWGLSAGSWICPRCKYKRPEGSAANPMRFFKKRRKKRQ